MRAPVLIVGQGLAGTALGLELEAAGVPFVVASNGHATAASRVAAGLINPVTGQRFVKSWRVDELLPVARAAYARWEQMLGEPLWHDVEIERRYVDAIEADRAARKLTSGALAPFAGVADAVGGAEAGVVVRGGGWVDLPRFLAAAEARWERMGRLRRVDVQADEWRGEGAGVRWRGDYFSAVVLATGAGRLARELFPLSAWRPVKGQVLAVRGSGIRGGRVVHRGVWLLGERTGEGRVGATFEAGRDDFAATADARDELRRAASGLVGEPLQVMGHAVGVRLAADDRLPAAGWHPRLAWLGLFGALGSKGALTAPWLAQRWGEELRGAGGLPAEVSVARLMT